MADGGDEDIIRTTGLDMTVMDDRKSVVLAFQSQGRDPIRVSMPTAVAVRFAQFIMEKLRVADGDEPRLN